LRCAQGYKPDFPPSKLKTGCGEQCIWVLDCLAEHVLQLQQFTWKLCVPSVCYRRMIGCYGCGIVIITFILHNQRY